MTDEIIKKAKEILEQNENFETALEEYLIFLAKVFNGHWIGLWKANEDDSTLKLFKCWHSNEMIHIDFFEADAQTRTHVRGEGMPGKAWRACAFFSSSDLLKDMMLPKSLKAHGAGLRSGMWFPIYINGNTIAVIELLRKDDGPIKETSVSISALLAKELATFLNENEGRLLSEKIRPGSLTDGKK